jgi:hypothetical protein
MGLTALLPLQRKCTLQIFITHKSPPSSAGPEPTTVGPVASTLTTRPPRAAIIVHTVHNFPGHFIPWQSNTMKFHFKKIIYQSPKVLYTDILLYQPSTFLEGLRKTTKNISHDKL